MTRVHRSRPILLLANFLGLSACTALLTPTGCAERTTCPFSHARAKTSAPAGTPEVIEEAWPSGQPKLRKELVRRPDGTPVAHGAWVEWYDGGPMQYQATYVDGKIDGVERTWHPNSQLATEVHFRHGQREGLRRTWDQQGRLRKEENWSADKPHGVWTVWEPDGKIFAQQEYDHGQRKP
jgi:hypothetical protein